MAFEESIKLAKETQKNMIATESGVRSAKIAYEALTEDIRLALGRMKYKKSNRHADVFVKEAIKSLKEEAKTILMKEIDDAMIRAGKEFEENSEIYKPPLYEIAGNNETYLFVPIGSGWGTKLSPQILFEHAGSLVDYARGITLYRNALRIKIGGEGSRRGSKATQWWRAHVYGKSRYQTTIEERLSLSSRIAPFWPLIAHGSMSLSSDRPDSSYNPYPAKGVDFISNAEDTLKTRFDELVLSEKVKWDEEISSYQKEIDQATKLQKSLEQDLEGLTTDYQQNQKALNKLGNDAKYVSEEKLAKAAERYRAGEEFDKVELTAPGMSREKRIRLSYRRFKGLME